MGQAITPAHLSNVREGDIVLLWSPYRGEQQPYLPGETAKWLAEKRIKMLGVEIPGVIFETNSRAPSPHNSPTHRHLMGNNIPMTYPLTNVSTLKQRVFYIGLPMNFERMEATWIRPVVLEERSAGTIAVGSGTARSSQPSEEKEGTVSDNIYLTWEANIKPGGEEGFKSLAKRWAEIAAADPGTLYSDWTISEGGKSVRLDGRYVDAAATMAQFSANLWADLEKYLAATGMVVCGKPISELEFLRGHGARFMVPVEE